MREDIAADLYALCDTTKIPDYQRFFKTGPGEYGEGDLFLGIKVPDIRKTVQKYFAQLSLAEVEPFLYSHYHEHRMFALLVLVYQYQNKKFVQQRESIFRFYVEHVKQINNWDLVDVTAPHIIGAYLQDKDPAMLYEWARSKDLWKKRIAVISTFTFIKAGEYQTSLDLCEILLHDGHDLIHKAVGWTLRTVGNKALEIETAFLKPRYKTMPRTMLRYAIEKFDEPTRQAYLKGLV